MTKKDQKNDSKTNDSTNQDTTNKSAQEKVEDNTTLKKFDEHQAGLDKKDESTGSTTPKDGEITVHVDSINEADKDPSKEIPVARHISGTGGVVGTAAGSQDVVASPTGNDGANDVIAGPAINEQDYQTDEQKQEANRDIRDMKPSAQEERKKEEAEKHPEDYGTEIGGDRAEDKNIQTAAKELYNSLVAGSGSAFLLRNGERMCLFTTEEHTGGQRKVSLRPEEVSINDDEAEVLNDYNNRVLTGPLS